MPRTKEKTQQITSISFGVLSPDEIRKMSVCEITESKLSGGPGSIYDERMGPDRDTGQLCKTCGQDWDGCWGHFGHIELNRYIVNPLYYKEVLYFLRSFCSHCHRLLQLKEQLELSDFFELDVEARFTKMHKLAEKIEMCPHEDCERAQPTFTHDVNARTYIKKYVETEDEGTTNILTMTIETEDIFRILDGIPDEEIQLLGFDPSRTHPRNLIFISFPVVPPCVRPVVMSEGNVCDDDLSMLLGEIVKHNIALANERAGPGDLAKALSYLRQKVENMFDNTAGNAKQTPNGRAYKGFKERIAGKKGVIRSNLLGKRVDFSGRTVISPDTSLEIDQIGIPQQIADNLTFPEIVSHANKERLERLVNQNKATSYVNNAGKTINLKYALFRRGTELMYGDIILREGADGKELRIPILTDGKTHLQYGDRVIRNGELLTDVKPMEKKQINLEIGNIVNRHLINGDPICFNRQPTLHSGSLMAGRVVRMPGKTIRLNLACCTSMNADFDGDEINLHAVQSLEAAAELEVLSSVKSKIISPQGGLPNIVIIQDAMLGAFLMTRPLQSHQKRERGGGGNGFEGDDKPSKKNFGQLSKEQFYQVLNFMKSQDVLRKIQHIRRVMKFDLKKKAQCFNGRGLFSALLPDDFHYEMKNNADEKEPIVRIYKGVMYEGAINKKTLGSSGRSIILLLHKEYGVEVVSKFLNQIQFCANNWLMIHSFSIGLEDAMVTRKEQIEDVLEKCYIEAEMLEKSTHHPGIREMKVQNALNKARDVGLRIAKDGLKPDNGFKMTVTAGSKGAIFNIAQLTGLLGQQNLKGKRIPLSLNQGKRTLSSYPINPEEMSREEKYESRGFVRSSFANGLNPREFYFHAMVGREGITDEPIVVSVTADRSIKRDKRCILLVLFIIGRNTLTAGNPLSLNYYL